MRALQISLVIFSFLCGIALHNHFADMDKLRLIEGCDGKTLRSIAKLVGYDPESRP